MKPNPRLVASAAVAIVLCTMAILHLRTILACDDCHTPFKMGPKGPEPDTSRALSGHPADVKRPPPPKWPEGWMFTGSATNAAFAMPPMPWMAIGRMTDADLGALFAALRALPPVSNLAPPSQPAGPPTRWPS